MRLSIWSGSALAAACLVSIGLLSACGGTESRPPPKPVPPAGVMKVTARPAAAAAVQVLIADVPPGRRIERVALIDAQGMRHPADSLVPVSVTEGGARAGPSIGIGVTGGSSSGINPSLSLGWNVLGGGAERQSRRIEARVPLADPAAYRAAPGSWRVEIVFTEIDGARRTLTFPAQPP